MVAHGSAGSKRTRDLIGEGETEEARELARVRAAKGDHWRTGRDVPALLDVLEDVDVVVEGLLDREAANVLGRVRVDGTERERGAVVAVLREEEEGVEREAEFEHEAVVHVSANHLGLACVCVCVCVGVWVWVGGIRQGTVRWGG